MRCCFCFCLHPRSQAQLSQSYLLSALAMCFCSCRRPTHMHVERRKMIPGSLSFSRFLPPTPQISDLWVSNNFSFDQIHSLKKSIVCLNLFIDHTILISTIFVRSLMISFIISLRRDHFWWAVLRSFNGQ